MIIVLFMVYILDIHTITLYVTFNRNPTLRKLASILEISI